eukprot:GHVH01014097.1.p1 GENE.GHVH01014097.1~~GHVH01014097.1.p1  ORF type:complete len:338 (-),score=61.15 GHVH01014097.1:804-1817(-)
MSAVTNQEAVTRLIIDLNAGKLITIFDRYHLLRVLQRRLDLKLCEGEEEEKTIEKMTADLKSNLVDKHVPLPFTLAERQLALQIVFKLNVLSLEGNLTLKSTPIPSFLFEEESFKVGLCKRVHEHILQEFGLKSNIEKKSICSVSLVLAQCGYGGKFTNALHKFYEDQGAENLYNIDRIGEIYDRHFIHEHQQPVDSPSVSFLTEDGQLSKEGRDLVEKLISSISLDKDVEDTVEKFKKKITGFFSVDNCKKMFQCLQLFCKGFRGDEDETHFNLLVDKIDHDSRTEEEKRADEEELTRLRKKREKELVKLEGEKKKQTTKKERKEKAGGGTGPNKP